MIRGTERSRGWGGWRKGFWLAVGSLFFCLLAGSAQAVDREAELGLQLKKINRYLDDRFCYDALTLARETRSREGGEKRFEVWEAIAKAHYCLGEVLPALATLEQAEQVVDVSLEQRTQLDALREQVKGHFAELKLRLPGGRKGRVTVELEQVGTLRDPSLQPFVDQVRTQLRAGTLKIPDTRIFLPWGRYRIDLVEFELKSFEGQVFVLGHERPQASQRPSLGDGQALGVGVMSLSGWQGDPLVLLQPGGTTQEVVGAGRLTSSLVPLLELSSTRAWMPGAVGYVGWRLDLQWRPPVTLPGDLETTSQIPGWATAGLSLRKPMRQGRWSLELGAGARVMYFAWLRYLAIVELTEGGQASGSTYDGYVGESYNISRMPIDMPTFGGGLEATAAGSWTLFQGRRPFQVGLEVRAGVSALLPMARSGEQVLETGAGQSLLSWRLYQERLWGSWVGTIFFVRVPFF